MFILLGLSVTILGIGHSQTDSPINMEKAVQIALKNSVALQTAKLEQWTRLAGIERDKPTSSPSVTAEAIGTLQSPTVLAPQAGGTLAPFEPGRYGKIEVRLDQMLYRPGAGSAKVRYRSEGMVAFWTYQKRRNDIILDCRRAYVQLKRAKLYHAVAQSGLQLAREQFEIVKRMLEAGTSTERDLKASDSDLAEAEQAVAKAANGVTLAAAELNRTMGSEGIDVQISNEDEPIAAITTLETAMKTALENRPEMKLLFESLLAARAGSALAGTQNKPTISARASAIAQTPSAYTDARYIAGSLVMTWHPFDNNKTRIDVNEANGHVAELESQCRELELGIRSETRKAILDYGEAEKRIGSITRQISSAQKSLDISRLRYGVNSTTQVEVSAALFALIKAKKNHAEAIMDRILAYAELQHSIGADIEVAPSENSNKSQRALK